MGEYQPVIILVHPQMGENIGMSARAMLNFGLKNMRIVAPRDGWPNEAAVNAAAGAGAVIFHDNMVFDTVEGAVADLHYVMATTARMREMNKQSYGTDRGVNSIINAQINHNKTGILFGAERSGLTNEDIKYAHAILQFDEVNKNFSSLNLSQAVMIFSYQYAKMIKDKNAPIMALDGNDAPHLPAKGQELNFFLKTLEDNLQDASFFRNPEMRPSVMRNIYGMFQRLAPSSEELRTLHGLIKALKRE